MKTKNSAEEFAVRPFSAGDVSAVESLLSNAPGAALWPGSSYANLAASNELAWIAEKGGTVCGFLHARVIADEAEILNLAVDSNRRRSGLATAMLTQAFTEFQGRGAKKLFLEVRHSNEAALLLYEKLGFTKTASRPGYYRDPVEAAVLLEKKLTG